MTVVIFPSSPIPQLKIFVIGLIFLSLFDLYRNWWLISSFFIETESWDFGITKFIIPNLMLAFGFYGGWHLKKYGWIIITFALTYITISMLIITLFEIKLTLNEVPFTPIPKSTDSLVVSPIDPSVFDEIFGRKSIYYYLLQLCIKGSLVYFMNRPSIINLFAINKKIQWSTIIIVLTLVLFYDLNILL